MLFAIIIHSLLLAWHCVAADSSHHHKHKARRHAGGKHDNAKRQWDGPQETGIYDYIVVGSGAGGAPLASRLARAGHSVLLIEAGDDEGESLEVKVPVLHLLSAEKPEMRWDYFVRHYEDPVQQARDKKMSYSCPDGSIYTGLYPASGCQPLGVLYPRSGTMGGCTQHNSEISVYPWETDWEYLEELTGNWTWSADSMRSYFVRLERNRYLPSSVVGHGYQGWLDLTLTPLTLVAEDPKITSLVLAAAAAMGKGLLGSLLNTVKGLAHVLATDLNAPGKSRDEDANLWQVPIAVDPTDSTRAGPRKFIYDTINNGYPLHFQPNTFVTKILFDQTGYRPRAYGVQYECGQYLYSASPLSPGYLAGGSRGQPGYAYARREVIISAGAFESPKLLMLSGIGDCNQLASFGIPCLVNLPGVGGNMQDRYEVSVSGKSPSPFPLTQECKWTFSSPDPCLETYLSNTDPVDRGVYGSNGLAVAITLKSSTGEGPNPDVYISGAPAKFTGYFPGFAEDTLADNNHWVWLILKARSRNNAGYVRLRSTNPFEMPEIQFNSFAVGGDEDIKAISEAVDFARRAFAHHNELGIDGAFAEDIPGPQLQGPALDQWIKDIAWGHHATGTCAIGRPDDPYAVLDGDFQVYGVDGLRVVDLSVFPKIPGYFVALPVYTISEKAADVILGFGPDPNAHFPDAGGLFGTLGYGLAGGLTQGVQDPEGLLGSFGGYLGGFGLFDNKQPIHKREQAVRGPSEA